MIVRNNLLYKAGRKKIIKAMISINQFSLPFFIPPLTNKIINKKKGIFRLKISNLCLLPIHELQGLIFGDSINTRSLIPVQHTIVFIRDLYKFGAESGADELAILSSGREVLDHLGYGSSVLCCFSHQPRYDH